MATVIDCAPVIKYMDEDTGEPRLGFNTKQTLTANMVETPEGYLICRDVALARTGTQIYLGREVPLEPGPDGTVVVERPEDEVFRPETIESFRGKPFTDDHPFEDVSPKNYKRHLIGTVMNPRRGEGDRSHCLLGDIIVYDADVVRAIKAGKREVSCGYDATYEKVEPGRGRQTQILGNHVSLVAEGRCGPTCAITDGKVTEMAKVKKSFYDNLRAAFKARDEEGFEEVIEAAKKEGVDESEDPERPETEEKEGGSNQHHVTVNIGGMSSDSANAMRRDGKAKDEDFEGTGGGEPSATEVIQNAVQAALAPIVERLASLEAAVEGSVDPDDKITTDAIARAEILKPGFKLPTFDAKPGSKAARDSVTAFQRNVLAEAFMTADGRTAIAPLVDSARPNFQTMDASTLNVVFRAASERMRDMNNARVNDAASVRTFKAADGETKVFDNASWNRKNKDFWARGRQ